MPYPALALLALLAALPVAFTLRENKRLALMALVTIVAVSLVAYSKLGRPEMIPLKAEYDAAVASVAEEVAQLTAKLKEKPDEVNSWARLGDIYMQLAHYRAAAEAYRQATLASGGHVAMILQYNKALIFADGGQVNDRAEEGLRMVLKLDPKNPEARYFLIMRKIQDGEMSTAMQEMKALYKELPAKSTLKMIIDRQIGRDSEAEPEALPETPEEPEKPAAAKDKKAAPKGSK